MYIYICYVAVHSDAASQCYDCYSRVNWEDCSIDPVMNCLGDANRCGYIYTKRWGTNFEEFTRTCLTEEMCDGNLCKGASGDQLEKCTVKCCDGEKCNDGTP